MFCSLRDQAEIDLVRSLKTVGRESKKSRRKADETARLAHQAAVALKIAAESKGLLTDEYIQELGITHWL